MKMTGIQNLVHKDGTEGGTGFSMLLLQIAAYMAIHPTAHGAAWFAKKQVI